MPSFPLFAGLGVRAAVHRGVPSAIEVTSHADCPLAASFDHCYQLLNSLSKFCLTLKLALATESCLGWGTCAISTACAQGSISS